MITPGMLRRYGAEVLGTFASVFFGCGARIVEGNGATIISRLAVYFTFGLTLFMMTYAASHISGAPFNPAVVVGLAVHGVFPGAMSGHTGWPRSAVFLEQAHSISSCYQTGQLHSIMVRPFQQWA